jgi:hypothetical protein
MSYKIIHDPIHGSIRVEGAILELFHSPQIQRLRDIKQQGLTNLIFPGANNTRFEHSLGVYYLTNKICEELQLEKDELTAAAVLHDCGHLPFSHTFEYLAKIYLDHDHVDLACEYILELGSILEKYGISPEDIIRIIRCEEKGYRSQIISGDLDVDRIDYLLRDAHYTGVAHGIIDVERILKTIEIRGGILGISEKGILAVEGMLIARDLMYASVYFHKTTRIAESMLARAVECIADEKSMKRIVKMTDSELLCLLKDAEGFPREIYNRLKCRDLFKVASYGELDLTFDERKALETEICEEAGIPAHRCIVDLPSITIPEKTEIRVFNEGTDSFEDHAILRKSSPPEYPTIISAPNKYKEKVRHVVERLL